MNPETAFWQDDMLLSDDGQTWYCWENDYDDDEPADGIEDDYNLGLCPQEPGDISGAIGLSDDGYALASAGFGTDEDYGCYGYDDF